MGTICLPFDHKFSPIHSRRDQSYAFLYRQKLKGESNLKVLDFFKEKFEVCHGCKYGLTPAAIFGNFVQTYDMYVGQPNRKIELYLYYRIGRLFIIHMEFMQA